MNRNHISWLKITIGVIFVLRRNVVAKVGYWITPRQSICSPLNSLIPRNLIELELTFIETCFIGA